MQGIRNAAFLMALGLAATTLGAMGWYGYAGFSFDPGMQSDIETVSRGVQNPAAETVADQPTFVSIATGTVQIVADIAMLNVNTYGIVVSVAGPGSWPIALAIQLMVNFTFGIALLSLWRGFKIVTG